MMSPKLMKVIEIAFSCYPVEATETPVCFMALVYDPDGNCLCIHKRKAK